MTVNYNAKTGDNIHINSEFFEVVNSYPEGVDLKDYYEDVEYYSYELLKNLNAKFEIRTF